jgi:hypothetical protein
MPFFAAAVIFIFALLLLPLADSLFSPLFFVITFFHFRQLPLSRQLSADTPLSFRH